MESVRINKRIRELLKDWVIPPGFQRVIRKIKFEQPLRVTAEETTILSRNAKFHNMYAGCRCFVIGNGPSLNKQDLTPLGDEITIVMNLFYRHPILERWQPTFYCAAEPGDRLRCDPRIIDTARPVASKIHPQAYFLPLSTKAIVEEHGLFPPEEVYFLKMAGMATSTRKLDLTKVIPGAPNTDHMATMIALALGCSPIYLLGLDYDKLSHRSYHSHFYDANDPVETRQDLSAYPYLHMIEFARTKYLAHYALREIGLQHNQEIFNATEGSFLDVYPMVTFEEALAGNHQGL